jgi:TolB protein
MKAVVRVAGNISLAILGAAAGVLFQTAPAAAAVPNMPTLVAYVRGGDVYVSKGATERKLTAGGGWQRPRFAPDGRQLAALRNGQLWTMKADGSAKRRLTTRAAAGASWSPDSKTLAFASLSCSGGPGVYRISATAVGAAPEVVFPSYCREEDLPAEPAAKAAVPGSLVERLRTDDAVAWSPDGTKVAFRGGDCESIYDDCLTVGTLATGGEKTVAAYGGGSRQNSGFAVVPSWGVGGAKLAWTAYQVGETAAENEPVHVVEYDVATGTTRKVGASQDRELAYLDAARGMATGTYRNGSWIMLVNLDTGARTPFHQGSQPSVQPKP